MTGINAAMARVRARGGSGMTCTTRTELPFPQYAWCATFETYDGAADSNCPIGFGATEAEAIADLTDNYDPPCPMCGDDVSNEYGYCRPCGEFVL